MIENIEGELRDLLGAYNGQMIPENISTRGMIDADKLIEVLVKWYKERHV